MRETGLILLMVCLTGTARAQSGFAADLLETSPAAGGLMTAQSPELTPGRFEVALGSDWAYHLLGIRKPGIATRWIVEQRLSLRAAVAYTPTDSIRLAAGFSGAPLQEGLRSNPVGAQVPMQAAMGDSWISLVWALPKARWLPLEAAVATWLMIPTAPSAGLTGSPRMDLRVEFLLSSRLWLLRPVLNLGVNSRPRTEFVDLARDDGLTFRLGLEAGRDGWPVFPQAEICTEFGLSGGSDLVEGIIGLRIPAFVGMEVQVGAGLGLHGMGAPAVRGLMLVRWVGQAEKRDGLKE